MKNNFFYLYLQEEVQTIYKMANLKYYNQIETYKYYLIIRNIHYLIQYYLFYV